jgi:hypothetical protein
MLAYGVLTQKNNGTYGLPVVSEFNRPKQITLNGVTHSRAIWLKWTNQQLVKKGFVKIQDETQLTSGKQKTDVLATETFSNDLVHRTYELKNIPVAPLRRALRHRVNGVRNGKIHAGLNIKFGGTDYVFETDTESLKNVSGVAAGIGAGVPMPLNADGTVSGDGTGTHISWRMLGNEDVLFTSAEFVSDIAGLCLNHVNGCHLAARAHKVAINALTTFNQIDTYDLEAGWPDVYVAPEE